MTENTYATSDVIRRKIAETMVININENWHGEPRNSRRIGSSLIGKSCSRQIWYAFRWAKHPEFGDDNRPQGQMMRLFSRGHREEIEIHKWLEDIGCVFEPIPDGMEQATFTMHEDHAVTKVDDIGRLPPQFEVNERVLFEYKTANQNAFGKIAKAGIIRQQPGYWAQANFTMKMAGIGYVCFVVVNKNTDELHIEIHKADPDYGQMLADKAAEVITAQEPPLKIAQSITNFACKWCNFADICHNGEKPIINCRSCKHAEPAADGKWVCKNPAFQLPEGGFEIPDDVIGKGCPHYETIPT